MPSRDTPSEPSIDADKLYPVVRRAVEDALWDVVGGVAYGLFLVLLGFVGLGLVAFGAGSSFAGVGLLLGLLGGLSSSSPGWASPASRPSDQKGASVSVSGPSSVAPSRSRSYCSAHPSMPGASDSTVPRIPS